MTDSTDDPGPRQTAYSGEAAWKATKEGVAARNAQARRAGKQRRQEHELQAARARAAADRREMEALVAKSNRR
jgi:uncharacterized protein involved in type VI secretion and phage assembly